VLLSHKNNDIEIYDKEDEVLGRLNHEIRVYFIHLIVIPKPTVCTNLKTPLLE